MKNKDTSWGKVAEWYDASLEENPDSYHATVILPNLLRLLDPKSKERVLDMACGQGFFTRALFEKGVAALGADLSPELIKIAQEKSPPGIKYFVSGADKCSFQGDHSLDAITCILAIQNIGNIREVFAECARMLVPGGRLLIVLNHPAFRIPKKSSWQYDEAAGVQYRRLDEYMSESRTEIAMHPGSDSSISTPSFHRPLQVYFKHLRAAGFAVTTMEEWISPKKSEKGPRAKAEDKARKEFPLFMVLEAVKLE